MRAGRLRHIAQVQRRTSLAPDFHGQPQESWTNLVVQLRCDLRMLSAQEVETAKQRGAVATHRVDARYVAGITPKDRIVFQGRTLYITSVENVGERGRELILLCGEQVS